MLFGNNDSICNNLPFKFDWNFYDRTVIDVERLYSFTVDLFYCAAGYEKNIPV